MPNVFPPSYGGKSSDILMVVFRAEFPPSYGGKGSDIFMVVHRCSIAQLFSSRSFKN
jgi:hypothetical protein